MSEDALSVPQARVLDYLREAKTVYNRWYGEWYGGETGETAYYVTGNLLKKLIVIAKMIQLESHRLDK